ncbi:hypothetical protein EYF80_011847 [Liparis tanakae]|uniref:Uncharacterized protein n=1 Tax=Liparis tanakae TaxID=230148 RepID=A0A4Z2IKC2_9TELE|nr:hypothetical protein EYF80_011847 [Liparis tanakae]
MKRTRLTASVELLPMRFSQLNLWLFSSGVLLAMNALWITRLGVLSKSGPYPEEDTGLTSGQRVSLVWLLTALSAEESITRTAAEQYAPTCG